MSAFIYRGPLSPQSNLFRGRQAELRQLLRWSQGDIQNYGIIYGGRQTGKTSLLLRFEHQLPSNLQACRVDFQNLSGASSGQAFEHFGQRIASCLNLPKVGTAINDASGLASYLCTCLGQFQGMTFILLIEELGALPNTTRDDLANAIRWMFTNRYDRAYRQLSRLMVILSGSIELYNLASKEVSPLNNICEKVYLPDLGSEEAVGLVMDGLKTLNVPIEQARGLSEQIYETVRGHPYLTQRIGGFLEDALIEEKEISSELIEQGMDHLLIDDPLLLHLNTTLKEHNLLESAKSVWSKSFRFTRQDEEMAQLELIGLVKPENGFWQLRNTLLKRFLDERIIGDASPTTWDVFISHASEDREMVAIPLAESLKKQGVKVWLDQFELRPGDKLLQSIDRGLVDSKYGIVILSPTFFAKQWTQHELGGLFSRSTREGRTVILPIWYQVGASEVAKFSPILSNLVAVSWSAGLDWVIRKLMGVIRPEQVNPDQKHMQVFGQVFSALSTSEFLSTIRNLGNDDGVKLALKTITLKDDYPLHIRKRAIEAQATLNFMESSALDELVKQTDESLLSFLFEQLTSSSINLTKEQIEVLLSNRHLPRLTTGVGKMIASFIRRGAPYTTSVFLPANRYPFWEVKYDCLRTIILINDQDSLPTLTKFSTMSYWKARKRVVEYIYERFNENRLSSKERELAEGILVQITTDGKTAAKTPTMRIALDALALIRGETYPQDAPQDAKYVINIHNSQGVIIGDKSDVSQQFNQSLKDARLEEGSPSREDFGLSQDEDMPDQEE